jgi:hypothetical protein
MCTIVSIFKLKRKSMSKARILEMGKEKKSKGVIIVQGDGLPSFPPA